MSCVKPAVVDCPDHRFTGSAKIIEQNLVDQKVTVNVVDVDDVRINLLNLLDESLGRSVGSKPVPVKQPCPQSVHSHTETIAHWDSL